MSETNDTTRRGKTLSLKKTETSTVKQSFSHGRTKAVVVEKKRARVPTPGAKPAETPEKAKPAAQAAQGAAPQAPAHARDSAARGGVVLRQLTDEEKEARRHALADARVAEEEARRLAEEDARRRAEEEAKLAAERTAAAKRKAEEDARKAAEEEAKKHAEEEAQRHARKDDEVAAAAVKAQPVAVVPAAAEVRPVRPRPVAEEEEDSGKKAAGKAAPKAPAVRKAPGDRRRGKLTVTKALSGDDERMRSVASYRRHLQRVNKGAHAQAAGPAGPREVTIPETITVSELANRMARRAVDVIKVLMKSGIMATVNDVIDADTAELVATEYGHTVKRVAESDVLEGLKGGEDTAEVLVSRPPVVTVMGHVDHGKTSLLDALRKTDVAQGEAGGITQHIGAYQVQLHGGQKITFLDTPGHAAFTAMRARGAKVTDIVVLVVAADDGVMPQTVEAISHAKAAGVPIIVAINKIDKADANPTRVKTELLQYEIQTEDMGGDTLAVEVSATKGTNLDKLEEAILLQAEVLDLKANPERSAEGAVIEAKLDKGRGPVATVLVERGTLKHGDIVVAGSEWGKVRVLVNDRSETVESAGPAMPVEVLGLSGVPEAGDEFVVVDSEARAREVTEYRARKRREARQATSSRQTLDQLLKSRKEGETKYLPLLIKADVQGSVEAIQGALEKLGTDEVAAQVLQAGVGAVTESDVILAHASGGAIIGFNVRANAQARERAKRDGVEIRYYNIIYNVVDDVKAVLSGMLAPEVREKFLGNAEVLEVFAISKVGKVAGCRVTEGQVRRGAHVRLIRDNVVIHEGELSTLKRFKDEVKEVQTGQECGMSFANYQDLQKGDVIECYEVETVQRAL
ncbi:MAG: translation initiation factor IF-2 [Alphaproteobacteria bacterium]|nr:translation initiation factor IF-2 [Alphaproteobacteria bacterium]MBU6471277.1 translation initiation factor IF-2 [Alphaproteobacteria bacterium]MDE2011964.1 translation initiation factor IF-2 [Alphaproteobacteria bacterium]MDE2072531.1 translation initiation factor IF-2 [Alphaproteobacteria bacterium]